MTKSLLFIIFLFGLVTNASAYPSYIPSIYVGGHVGTQIGYRDIKTNCELITDGSGAKCGGGYHDFAIVNDTQFDINFEGKTWSGVKYGAQITLNADTTNNKTNHANDSTYKDTVGYYTYSYFESALGKLELGTNTGAVEALKINAGTIARATGGVNGDWKYWVGPNLSNLQKVQTKILINPDLPTNFDKAGEDKAAKVTYYTPNFHGFTFGLSYIPDTEQHGSVARTQAVKNGQHTNTVDTFRNGGYKEVFSGGVKYQKNISQSYNIGLAAIGEVGKAKNASFDASVKRESLGAYEVGAELGVHGLTFAGSYGNWHKSGQSKRVFTVVTGKQDASYWTAGVGYALSNMGLSVTYMDSLKGNGGATRSTFSNISTGFEYNAAPGFMPYIEVSYFKMNEKSTTNGYNAGVIALAGTKLVF